jgi:hypothetical protein
MVIPLSQIVEFCGYLFKSILVIAVIAAVLSTAFGLSSMTTYATQESKVSYEKTSNNEQHD